MAEFIIQKLRFSRYNSIFGNDSLSELTHIKNYTFFARQFNNLGSIWSDLHQCPALMPHLLNSSFFLTMVKSTQLRSATVSRISLIWQGFQYWVAFFGGERRVLKYTPSKRKQLGRSLCIVVIFSWRYTGVALALFQVLAFDRLCLGTLNNIFCLICVYYTK